MFHSLFGLWKQQIRAGEHDEEVEGAKEDVSAVSAVSPSAHTVKRYEDRRIGDHTHFMLANIGPVTMTTKLKHQPISLAGWGSPGTLPS